MDITPINIEQYIGKLLGNRKTVTENDLWQSDLQALRNAVGKKKTPEGIIEYGEYGPANEYQPSAWDEGWGHEGPSALDALFSSYIDPKFRMETTLGAAKYHTDPNGDVIVQDTYDWGASPEYRDQKIKESGSKLGAVLQAYKTHGLTGGMNAAGNIFIGTDSTGAPIRINIGKMNNLGDYIARR